METMVQGRIVVIIIFRLGSASFWFPLLMVQKDLDAAMAKERRETGREMVWLMEMFPVEQMMRAWVTSCGKLSRKASLTP